GGGGGGHRHGTPPPAGRLTLTRAPGASARSFSASGTAGGVPEAERGNHPIGQYPCGKSTVDGARYRPATPVLAIPPRGGRHRGSMGTAGSASALPAAGRRSRQPIVPDGQ